MEIRIRIPDSLSSLRYLLRNPKSFIKGIYTFDDYIREYRKRMFLEANLQTEISKHQITRNKLIEANKELSQLKRKGREISGK